MDETIRLADFGQLGVTRLFPITDERLGQCFAIRVEEFDAKSGVDDDADGNDSGEAGELAIAHPDGGFVIGYSAVCTHMGCLLARSDSDHDVQYSPDGNDGHQVTCGPCPCHGTTFDLIKCGLVVLGPATRNLPQLRLALVDVGGQAHVKPVGWAEEMDPRSNDWPAAISEGR